MSTFNKNVKFKQWDCVLRKGKYPNGRVALYLEDAETFERIAKCTVNIEYPIEENQTFIKDYEENEGMLKALLDAGAITQPVGTLNVKYGTHDITFPIVEIVE